MKAIYVTGDDYGALHFENTFGGTKVSDIIENIQDYTLAEHGGNFEVTDDYEYWEIQVIEVGEVSPEFVGFIRNRIQDGDDAKHVNFYLEGEVIS